MSEFEKKIEIVEIQPQSLVFQIMFNNIASGVQDTKSHLSRIMKYYTPLSK